MLKFKDYIYSRPNIDECNQKFEELFTQFQNAASVENQNKVITEINKLRNTYYTMETLVSIRYSINTEDDFYAKEKEFMDETSPIFSGIIDKFYTLLATSKFRQELEEKWGKQLFTIIELQRKTFKPEIIEDLQKENKLVSQYQKVKASAKIMFDGQEKNLAQMGPYMMSTDRDTRYKASKAVSSYYLENEAEFDRIYDELVKIRHTIAKKLGFDNFVKLGYARLTRSDYDEKMVANYRKQVLENIVPLASKLKERQKNRLGLKDLKFYDESLIFLNGNATPKGDTTTKINTAKEMYSELSPETKEFFDFMVSHDLLDLDAKPGKDMGGYCTFIGDYMSPFIFANFNGTSGDVEVLTHEAGHAFQVYQSMDYEFPEYRWATQEATEIHSMSMEFFTYPWMKDFFFEDEPKYKFTHVNGTMLFIPYGVAVDEFQHWVYENYTATPDERKHAWREIEKKYLPHRDYDDDEFLSRGGYWFRQLHIFVAPFYYIDYTLAQVCAYQFYKKSLENKEAAWEDYLKLCRAGGSKSFLGLLEVGNLENPFEDGTIKASIEPLEKWINSVDDSSL